MKALLFDLDDTLYLERDYVASGYQAIARHLSRRYGCDERRVFLAMISTLVTRGRKRVIPMVVRRFLGRSVPIEELVQVYRGHTPHIRMLPGYDTLLKRLARRYRLGVITDGLPQVQRRKTRALRLDERVDRIIYTWDYGSDRQKPHPFSFMRMLGFLGAKPCNTVYVGDNEEKDCAGARSVGIRFVHVRGAVRGDRRHGAGREVRPEFRIDSLHELPGILESFD